jgi:hypothetical protein
MVALIESELAKNLERRAASPINEIEVHHG